MLEKEAFEEIRTIVKEESYILRGERPEMGERLDNRIGVLHEDVVSQIQAAKASPKKIDPYSTINTGVPKSTHS